MTNNPYKFEVGDRGGTRGEEGKPETQRAYEITAIGENYMLAKLLPKRMGEISEIPYHKNGSPVGSGGFKTTLDLLPTEKKVQGWVNAYESGWCGEIYPTKQEAVDGRSRDSEDPCISCGYVEFIVGEGL